MIGGGIARFWEVSGGCVLVVRDVMLGRERGKGRVRGQIERGRSEGGGGI